MSAVTPVRGGSGVPKAPWAPVRARAAKSLLERAAVRLEGVEIVLPDGRLLRAQAGAPRLTITNDDFFHRLGAHGKIGFGEAYMAGDWDADDLAGALTVFGCNVTTLVPRSLQRLRRVYEPRMRRTERNTIAGSRHNISRHYDLSNELFALFLDDSMTYSSAVFAPGDTLEQAQRRKYEAVAALARVGPGSHVLEVGSGWGGMAIHLARDHGCRVTTVTISEEQQRLARRRAEDAGVADAVDVRLLDYRQVEGRYDAIVSVEMLEAVGEEFLAGFFARCDALLAPGGRIGLQTITMPHPRYLATRGTHTWVHKYIFPGGLIPSRELIERSLAETTSLRVGAATEIGAHYATTLRLWRQRFLARRAEVLGLGFDDVFVRAWDLYLAYCEAGFRSRAIGTLQLSLERRP